MKLCLEFNNGTFVCDRWPEDLNQTVGRMVLAPWKTIYAQAPDHIYCGKVIRVVSSGPDARLEISNDASIGSCIVPVADCFLVPLDAEVQP